MKRIVFTLIVSFFFLNGISGQITWDGGGFDGLWSTPANWSGNVVPGSGDEVIFDNVTVVVEMDILTSFPTYVINSLLITNNANVTLLRNENGTTTKIFQVKSTNAITKGLQIDAGSLLLIHGINTTGTFNYILDFAGAVDVTGEISGELQFSGVGSSPNTSDVRLRIYVSPTSNANLNVKNNGIIRYLEESGNTNSFATGGPYLTMESGSLYILERDAGSFPNGGLWDANSIARVENLTGTNAASFVGNSYGNLIWNTPLLTSSIAPTFFNDPTFNNVTFISTNNFSFVVRNSNGIRNITINGFLVVNANSKIELTSSLVTAGGGKIILNGNLNNLGNITSSGMVGTINDFILNGSTPQSIRNSGTVSGTLKLVMNNPAGASLHSNLTIPDSLALTNGIITTKADSLLTMVDDAKYSGGSINSFINGPMKKIGNDDFIFPVGASSDGVNGIFAPIGITNVAGESVTDEFTAEYKRVSPQNTYGVNYFPTDLDHISFVEYWTLENGISTTATKNVSLDVRRTSFCLIPSTTFVSRFNGTSWTKEISDISGLANCPLFPTYQCGFITTTDPQSNFGPFTLSTTDPFAVNPLPLKLLDFTATKISNTLANIKWELADVISKNAIFEIEKSTDNRVFSLLATISGNETNRYYSFNDPGLGKGITWYRLKMTDVDGAVKYSNIVAIFNEEKGFVITSIAPNPVHSTATITLGAAKQGSVQFKVYNMSGNIVKQWLSGVAEGTSNVNMNVAGLSAGAYIVVAYGMDTRATFRFIKQ